MSENTCFVITGLIDEEYTPFLIESYKDINHKIVSTWYDQDKIQLDILESNGFILVLNTYPTYKNSTNFQKIVNFELYVLLEE